MHCNPTSVRGHGYIIVAVEHFTKWAEAMPTYAEDGKLSTLFLFNHIIAWFGVPQAIVTDHGSHFCNQMMPDLSTNLVFIMRTELLIICRLMAKSNPLTKS